MCVLLGGAMRNVAYAKPANKDTLSVEEQQQFLYYFYEAQRLIQKEDIVPAWELMQFCYELNPNDAAVNNYMGIFLDAFDSVIARIYDEDIFSAYKDRRFENSADLVEAVFCMDSGKIPCEACLEDARGSRLKKGYFVKGTEPKQECDVHVFVDYDMICGGVANAFTPDEHITKVGMLNIQRSFPVQIYVSDAQYVVRFPPDNVMPSFDSKKAFFSTLEGKEKYFGTSPTATQFNRFSTAHINYSDWIFYRKLYRR